MNDYDLTTGKYRQTKALGRPHGPNTFVQNQQPLLKSQATLKDLLSPKQVARAMGVSESSLKRWCDRGLIPTVRTAGGHRRLPISGVLTFLRETNQNLVDPEILGLPATSGKTDWVTDRARDVLRESLLIGDEASCRQVIFDLWLAGQRLSEICDRVIAGAFVDIGDKWVCREAEVYQERRACEIVIRALHELRSALPAGDPHCVALGGTAEGDQYVIPTTAAEIVLRDAGWQAHSLGSSIPFASLAVAIREHQPRLFWLSVSHVADRPRFLEGFQLLNTAASEAGTAITVGGFALDEGLRQQMRYSAFCDTMQHLEEFANTLRARS